MSRTRMILRQYSVSNDNDFNNIENDRCPEYAIGWGHNSNQNYWLPGDDYFIGNCKNLTDNHIVRQMLSEKLARGTLPNKIIFCDLDGVLANFNKGVVNIFKKSPDQLNKSVMWSVINKSKTFFETLPWMPRGRELWEKIKKYDPIILTGIPRSSSAAKQKRAWCARELGPEIHVVTCSTKDKPKFCIKNSLLIDDRNINLTAWNDNGGKFILYHEEFTDQIIERINKHMSSDSGLNTP